MRKSNNVTVASRATIDRVADQLLRADFYNKQHYDGAYFLSIYSIS